MTRSNPTGSNKLTDITELTIDNGKVLGWNNNKISNIIVSDNDPRIIVSNTKPTTRSDGSALQDQDEWRSIRANDHGIVYYWSYSDWHTASMRMGLTGNDSTSRAASVGVLGEIYTNFTLVVERVIVMGTRGGTHNASAYWSFGLAGLAFNNSVVTVFSSTDAGAPTTIPPSGQSGTVGTIFASEYILNTPVNVDPGYRLRLDYTERAGAVTVQNVTSVLWGRWKAV